MSQRRHRLPRGFLLHTSRPATERFNVSERWKQRRATGLPDWAGLEKCTLMLTKISRRPVRPMCVECRPIGASSWPLADAFRRRTLSLAHLLIYPSRIGRTARVRTAVVFLDHSPRVFFFFLSFFLFFFFPYRIPSPVSCTPLDGPFLICPVRKVA